MCLSVRVALTPPYVQVMQRKTSLSQEQGLAGSNPALHTIYTPLAQLVEHLTLNQGGMGSNPIRRTLCTGDGTWNTCPAKNRVSAGSSPALCTIIRL